MINGFMLPPAVGQCLLWPFIGSRALECGLYPGHSRRDGAVGPVIRLLVQVVARGLGCTYEPGRMCWFSAGPAFGVARRCPIVVCPFLRLPRGPAGGRRRRGADPMLRRPGYGPPGRWPVRPDRARVPTPAPIASLRRAASPSPHSEPVPAGASLGLAPSRRAAS